MQPFYLVETITQDKLIHQGIFYKPYKPGKIAILWIHGLTDNFYGDRKLFEVLTHKTGQLTWGFASFNNRGHDFVTSCRKVDKRKPKGYTHTDIGTGMEKFSDCVFDITAGVDFLTKQGFNKIFVIGHSTGANKVCFYAATKYHKTVAGFILACPISDRLDLSLNKIKLQQDLNYMQDLANQGQGEILQTGYLYFPVTPNRFLSLYTPNSLEDQFDYGDPRPRMTHFSQITKPLLVVFAGKDEYADRSVNKIKKVFDESQRSTNYKSVIIPGAVHGFDDLENEFVEKIIKWIKDIK